MANKKYMESRIKMEKGKEFSSKRKRLRLFALGSLLMAIVILLMMLSNWAAIYNTNDAGNEIEVSGFNCASTALSGNYKSFDQNKYGDIAVFNKHAAAYIERLSVVSLVVLFVVIVHALIALFGLITNKQKIFGIMNIAFAVAEAALFITCHAIAISMNHSGILTTYCSNNPACSVQSQAIMAGLFAILSVALPVVGMLYENKIAKEEAAEAATPAKAPVSFAGGKRKKRR